MPAKMCSQAQILKLFLLIILGLRTGLASGQELRISDAEGPFPGIAGFTVDLGGVPFPIASLALDIQYDPSVLAFHSFEPLELGSQFLVLDANEQAPPGTVRVFAFSPAPVWANASASLVKVRFEILAECRDSVLEIVNLDEDLIGLTAASGRFFCDRSSPIEGNGDVDGDGVLTPRDALLIYRHLEDPAVPLTAAQQRIADVVDAGSPPEITEEDLQCVLNALLGKPSCLGPLEPRQASRSESPGAANKGAGALRDPRALAISDDGNFLYVARGLDNAISVYALTNDGPVLVQEVVQGAGAEGLAGVTALAISPDGSMLYSCAFWDNAVAAFDRNAGTGALVQRSVVQGGGSEALTGPVAVAISPDSRFVYAATLISSAILVLERDFVSSDLISVQTVRTRDLGEEGLAGPNGVAVAPDGSAVYAAAFGSSVSVFNRAPATGLLELKAVRRDGRDGIPDFGQTNSLALSPEGTDLYVTALNLYSTGRSSLAHFDAAQTGGLEFINAYTDGTEGIHGLSGANSITLSPDGLNLYTTGFNLFNTDESSVAVFNRDSRTGVLTFLGAVADGVEGVDGLFGATDFVVSPDGERAYAAGSFDNAVAIFRRAPADGMLVFDGLISAAGPRPGVLHLASGPEANDDFMVLTVSVQDSPVALSAIGFEVAYDKNVFTFDSHVAPKDDGAFDLSLTHELGPGIVRVVAMSSLGHRRKQPDQRVLLATLRFLVDACPDGGSPLSVANLVGDLEGVGGDAVTFACETSFPPDPGCFADRFAPLESRRFGDLSLILAAMTILAMGPGPHRPPGSVARRIKKRYNAVVEAKRESSAL